jgi:YtxH-like protein
MRRKERPEVVYVKGDGDSSVKWLLWGAAIGAGIALLYAPRSGEETRRSLQRRLWKLRAMTEEKLDELVQQFGDKGALPDEEEFEEDAPLAAGPSVPAPARRPPSPRQELERRLSEARARRRAVVDDDEEPLA